MPFNPMEALRKARSPQPELAAKLGPVTQSGMPMLPGVGAFSGLKGLAEGGLEKVAPAASSWLGKASQPVAETLGETNPMFTPVGGEGLYNVAKQGLKRAVDPVEAAYTRILATMGKWDAT